MPGGRGSPFRAECCVMPDGSTWRVRDAQNAACDLFGQKCATFTIVSEKRREIVVAFRGTTTPLQLFQEAVYDWERPGFKFRGLGLANNYFAMALDKMWAGVHKILSDPALADFCVTFTGHSLGGAFASLAALRSVHEGLRESCHVRLYTFGQPRVGDAVLAAKHDELVPHSFRVVNRADIVPHVPPCNPDFKGLITSAFGGGSMPCLANYNSGAAHHHGTEIWYQTEMPSYESPAANEQQQFRVSQTAEDYKCSDHLAFPMAQMGASVADHLTYFGRTISEFGKQGCNI